MNLESWSLSRKRNNPNNANEKDRKIKVAIRVRPFSVSETQSGIYFILLVYHFDIYMRTCLCFIFLSGVGLYTR